VNQHTPKPAADKTERRITKVDQSGMKKNSFFKTRSLFCLAAMSMLILGFVSCFSGQIAIANGQTSSGPVLIANFDSEVDPGSAAFIQRVVSEAKGQHASAMIIQMNTPGGLLSDMRAIISSITEANQSGIPVYTYIVPNGLGASAGSYIAMATNKILMGPGSVIGPSTPIVVGGSTLEQNQTQAAMLELMTSLAQTWGRNVTSAYEMVQGDRAFSAIKAVSNHVVDASVTSLSAAVSQLGLTEKTQIILDETLYEQFISVLSNPILDGILILLGVLVIVIDIFHPTIILTVVGIISIILGLIGAEVVNASLFGFLILAIAAVLMIVELKLGHGFALIAGAVLGAFGIYYLYQGIGYSPSPITITTEIGLTLVVIIGVVAGLYIRWIITPIRRHAKLTGPESIIGKSGVAITDLSPMGEARVEGIIWRAQSESGEVKKGEQVKVKSIQGLLITVEKTQSSE
jgi:membrane-bound serine protease (ClpP class)